MMTGSPVLANRTVPLSLSADTSGRQQTIVLHDDGDVTLVVGKAGGVQQPIQASKTTMSLASPVWKAMFSRVWAEHAASEILLPDDDVSATLTVLRIAHLQFQDLPKKGDFSPTSLLNLAVICDKYDLVRIVRPFLDLHGWASPWFSSNTDVASFPQLLFSAWTFVYSQSFESMAKDVLDRLIVTFSGAPMIGGATLPEPMPPGLLDRMIDLRKQAITSMLDACYGKLDQVLQGPVCKQEPPSETECRCMILGSYISFLVAQDLYPVRRQAADVSMSLIQLYSTFKNFRVYTHDSHDYEAIVEQARKSIEEQARRSSGFYSNNRTPSIPTREYFVGHGVTEHKTCGEIVNIATRATQIWSQLPSPVLDEHSVHMAAQAKK